MLMASLVAQQVKNPPALRETLVQSLGWKDPLEKGATTHSSILAWKIPRMYIVHGVTKSHTQLSTHTHALREGLFPISLWAPSAAWYRMKALGRSLRKGGGEGSQRDGVELQGNGLNCQGVRPTRGPLLSLPKMTRLTSFTRKISIMKRSNE